MAKKKQSKDGRVDLGMRVTPSHAELITKAAKKDAQDRGVLYSRNNFCASATVAAARKVLADELAK